MPTYLRPQVVVTEETPGIRSLPRESPNVLGAQGITERGPVRTATRVTSFDEFQRIYGGLIAAGELPLQIRQFFLNGGSEAWISRVVHYTAITDNTTGAGTRGAATLNTAATAAGAAILLGTVVGPWDLRGVGSGGTLIATFGPAGLLQGPSTATVTATAAARTSAAGPFNFTGVLPATLTVAVDGGANQAIVLTAADFVAVGAATAAEVAAAINGRITGARATVAGATVVLTSDRLGTGSGINVVAGGANGVLGFTTGNVAGTGNVSNLGAVQFAEIETIVELAWNVTDPLPGGNAGINIVNNGGRVEIRTVDVGATITLDVGAGTLNAVFGFVADPALVSGTSGAAVGTLRVDGKYEGAYSGTLAVEIRAATDANAEHFNLRLYRAGALIETFHNLTMDAADARYVVTIIGAGLPGAAVGVGQTEMIRVADLGAAGTTAQRRPANTSADPAVIVTTALTAGSDGLVGLVDVDFTGDVTAQTGHFAFNPVRAVRLFISPDRPTAANFNALTTYAEVTRGLEGMAVLDTPAGQTHNQIVTFRNTLTASEFGALYWPRVLISNPSAAIYGTAANLAIGPAGSIAGMMARTANESRRGAFEQPAGPEVGRLFGIVGVEDAGVNRDEVQDLIFPARINPIVRGEREPVWVNGARTLRANGNFPSVGERRGASDVIATVRLGLRVYLHRNNDSQLRGEVENTLVNYLTRLTRDGAFASQTPSAAFFVDVSTALNPPSVQRLNELRVRIGLATSGPAEFIVVLLSQDLRALNEELGLAA